MQWVQNNLLPMFKNKYPGKKLMLVAVNAPYHHKREIDSLFLL